jgi:hypothetical protein
MQRIATMHPSLCLDLSDDSDGEAVNAKKIASVIYSEQKYFLFQTQPIDIGL